MTLVSRTIEALRRLAVLESGAGMLVAVSGGRDSTVLAHVMAEIASEWQLPLSFACIDHGLRREASGDVAFVRDLAARLGAHFVTAAVDVRGEAARTGTSLQAAARTLRYAALERLRIDTDAQWILTAHHADDQAETLVMRFLRGAGPGALAGIRERYGCIVRPLLHASADDIARHASEHGIVWREDASNQSDAYLRNAIRHHVMPAMRAHANPGIVDTLGREARLHALLDDYLEAQARQAAAACTHSDGGAVFLDVVTLSRYFQFQRYLVYRHVLRTWFGCDAAFAAAEDLDSLTGAQRGSTRDIGTSIHAVRTRDALMLERRHQLPSFRVSVKRDEEVALPGGARFCCRNVPREDVRLNRDPGVEFVDTRACVGEWMLRNARPGDMMQPLGMQGHRTVFDVLADAGVPSTRREEIPVLECERGIIWVCGVRLDERARITDATQFVTRLDYHPAQHAHD